MKKEQQHTKKTIFFIVTSILMTIYLLWRVFFTLPFQEGILQVIFGILLIVAETITVFTTFELYYRKIKSDNYQLDLPDIQDEDYPDIDVFIATHNEMQHIMKVVIYCIRPQTLVLTWTTQIQTKYTFTFVMMETERKFMN